MCRRQSFTRPVHIRRVASSPSSLGICTSIKRREKLAREEPRGLFDVRDHHHVVSETAEEFPLVDLVERIVLGEEDSQP